jgi:hypothetical protein
MAKNEDGFAPGESISRIWLFCSDGSIPALALVHGGLHHFLRGKSLFLSSISMGHGFHGYMLNNQRV